MKNKYKKTRKQIKGSYHRPRLCINKSNQHIYAQIINDFENKTLHVCSTLDYEIRSELKTTSTSHAASIVGHAIATKSLKHGIQYVVFDKRNKPYHGKIKALADAARKAGLSF